MSFNSKGIEFDNIKWTKLKLEELCDVIDSLHKSPKYVDTGYPMIRVKDMEEGYLKLENTAFVTKDVFEEFTKKHRPKKGDILFSRVGSYGITTFVDTNKEFCLGQNTVVITNYKGEVDNKYLYYSLVSSYVKEQIEKYVTGSTQKTISMKSIKALEIFTPPLQEQKAIAKILSDLDEKIETNNKINKTLEEMAQAIFKQWFVDFEFPNEDGKPYKSSGGEMVESELGMIPKGWKVIKLHEIGNLTMGLSPKSKSYNTIGEGTPLLNGAADFNDGLIKPQKYTTQETRVCRKNDLVFCIRATIGNITFADREYCLGRGVAAVEPKKNLYVGLIYMNLLKSMEKLKAQATGSVILGLSKSDINDMQLILPNNDIVDKFSNIFNKVFDKKFILQLENDNLIKLRDTLLPKLMSGEIRVPLD